MKYRSILYSLILSIVFCNVVRAQDYIHKDSIDVINIGEGRMLHTFKSNGEALQGSQRINDGTTSGFFTATFQDGLFEGSYVRYRTLGRLVDEAEYSAGRRHGVSREYFSDGEKVKTEITYSNGKRNGPTITYYLDGSRESETEYADGLKHGYDKRWDYADGTLTTHRHFIRDTLHGSSIEIVRSNISDYVVTCHYRMGVLHGRYVETYTDGAIRTSGTYVNGEKHGKWRGIRRTLEDNGKVRSKKFKAKY